MIPQRGASRFEPETESARKTVSRLFLCEPGWRVAVKVGSEREFCYMTAPGQDYYHRLLDGEVYVQHGDEKLCLSCADRRGLLSHEPRRLGAPVVAEAVEGAESASDYDIGPPRV